MADSTPSQGQSQGHLARTGRVYWANLNTAQKIVAGVGYLLPTALLISNMTEYLGQKRGCDSRNTHSNLGASIYLFFTHCGGYYAMGEFQPSNALGVWGDFTAATTYYIVPLLYFFSNLYKLYTQTNSICEPRNTEINLVAFIFLLVCHSIGY